MNKIKIIKQIHLALYKINLFIYNSNKNYSFFFFIIIIENDHSIEKE